MKIGVIDQFPDQPSQLNSAAFTQFQTLNAVEANTVGWWDGPFVPFRHLNLEVTSDNALVGNVKMVASNAAVMPPNGFVLSIGGTHVANDVLSIILDSSSFSGAQVVAQYKVIAGDTSTIIAAALAAALLAAISQEVHSPVVPPFSSIAEGFIPTTLTPEQQNAVAYIQVSTATNTVTVVTAQPGMVFSVQAVATSGETITQAQYDSQEGFQIGTTITAEGRQDIETCAMWLKTTLDSYNSSSGAVDAIVIGVLP